VPRRSAHKATDVEVIDRHGVARRAAIASLDINSVFSFAVVADSHSVR
jgi:hypothetical protein